MATVNKLNAADANHDGVIEYDEFVLVAMEILRSQNGGGQACISRSNSCSSTSQGCQGC